jgi:fatty-acid desaturase
VSLTPVTADVGGSRAERPAPLPQLAQPLRLVRVDAVAIAAIHLVALLAFVPWFFSWTGLVLAFLGLYVFGTLGISLCFHRLLTHRSLVCPDWLEHSLAILGLCCAQDTPARWVGIHRRHHEHADEQPDPHRPAAGFLWAHIGWMIYRNRDLTRLKLVSRYSKDIIRDPFYARLEQNFRWVGVVLISWLCFFGSGFFIGLLVHRNGVRAIQFGFSVLVWGVFVRTVVVWHITWSVNSLTHLWGYRNYDTSDSSRNNILVGLLSNGEGWHNNHHADPRSARFGRRWWELDATWLTIRLLSALGLARKVVTSRV